MQLHLVFNRVYGKHKTWNLTQLNEKPRSLATLGGNLQEQDYNKTQTTT